MPPIGPGRHVGLADHRRCPVERQRLARAVLTPAETSTSLIQLNGYLFEVFAKPVFIRHLASAVPGSPNMRHHFACWIGQTYVLSRQSNPQPIRPTSRFAQGISMKSAWPGKRYRDDFKDIRLSYSTLDHSALAETSTFFLVPTLAELAFLGVAFLDVAFVAGDSSITSAATSSTISPVTTFGSSSEGPAG